ncbi:MAG: hypothetical protein U0169_18365 [Polyangiaceae bacterium]
MIRFRSFVSPVAALVASSACVALLGLASPSEAAPKPVLREGSSETFHSHLGGSSAEKAGAWKAEIKAEGACKAGSECKATVKLTTTGAYHINKEYPYKLVVAPVEGVKLAKESFKRADGTFDEHTGTFVIAFTPSKAGKVKLASKFNLSACSEKDCLMERPDLELEVDVK